MIVDESGLLAGRQHVRDVQEINRLLIERAFKMRCVTYLSQVKSQLLTQTIYEIDSSKKELMRFTRETQRQNEVIEKQKNELEKKNKELEEARAALAIKFEKRSKELEDAIAQNAVLQQQFLSAQKFESIGRLAGGLAHDFNNILSAIMGYCQLAMLNAPESGQMADDLSEIYQAGERAVVLVRKLLAVSRRQELDLEVFDVNDAVRNISNLLARTLGDDIELVLQLVEGIPNIKADLGQLEQVLLNLAINARDAMKSGGKLIIEVSELTLDETYSVAYQEIDPGPYVMVAFTDTGCGMENQVLEKIFDPFFTTKEEGTGLGLASVHGIIRQHRGVIHVYSEVGVGTTFKIYLPATEAMGRVMEKSWSRKMPRGSETVLVVDDEPAIRHLVTDTLQPLGYTVWEASDGQSALEQYADKSIDLLLSDVIMPGMYGLELSRRFLSSHSGTKVIFMSGYTAKTLDEHGDFEHCGAFLPKPVTPSQLASTIRSVLDS